LEYSARYLNRQLAIARKIKQEVAAKLAVTPDEFIASICGKAVDNRIAMLQECKAWVGKPKGRLMQCVTKPLKKVGGARKLGASVPSVRGVVAHKFSNTDRSLNKCVDAMNGNLFVCNLNLLWG